MVFIDSVFSPSVLKQDGGITCVLKGVCCVISLIPGPRARKPKKSSGSGSEKGSATIVVPSNSSDSSQTASSAAVDDKRPRTAFSGPQLARLKVMKNP